ncbi:MAG TPA: hypothetical protein PKJ39_05450 [Caldisericia bacterium]|nr:hypothetical protein [Caldisericia bacterium]
MNNDFIDKIRSFIKTVLKILDTILSLITLLIFLLSLKYLPYFLNFTLSAEPLNLISHFQYILSYILLLAILLELMVVLVRFSTFALIDTLIIIIVRELLTHPGISMNNILYGVIGVGILSFVRRFCFTKEERERKI